MFFDYDFEDKLNYQRLMPPALAAEHAIARLGERLRTLPMCEGVLERLVYHEASSVSLIEGELVPVEDLVGLEGGCLQRLSYHELSTCYGHYIVLRHAGSADAAALLGARWPGEARETGTAPEKLNDMIYDQSWDGPARLSAWRQLRRDVATFPPMLAAALVWDGWQMLLPEQHGGWKAPMLGALVLKDRKTFVQGVLPIAWGMTKSRFRWSGKINLNDRLLGFFGCVVEAAERSHQEINRLVLADAQMARRLEGRREIRKCQL